MIRRVPVYIIVMLVFLAAGCIKETYNMNKLSEKVSLSPSLAVPVMNGNMTLADLVREVDTVLFDQDKFATFVFRKDSVLNLNLADYYDFSDMVSFNDMYEVGNLGISSFSINASYSLNQIRTKLGEPYYTAFGNIDGTTAAFPPFPSIDLGNIPFPAIPNLENAVFSSGYLVISITNNLTAPLKPITVAVKNTIDNSPVGGAMTIPAIPVGETRADSIDLTDATMLNMISASVVLDGSDGNLSPSPVDLNNNNISIVLKGSNLKIKSGRVILPPNKLTALSGSDVINFDPGSGIEIDKIKILTANFSCHVEKPGSLAASITFTLPDVLMDGAPVSHTMNLGPGNVFDTNLSLDNTTGNLAADPLNPFNRLAYNISISSSGMIDVVSTDIISMDLRLHNPSFDYIKGYFGQEANNIKSQVIDLGIEDLLKNLNTFSLSDPSIKVDYRNSFALPAEIYLQATGVRDGDSIGLGLAPFITEYSLSAPASRDASGSEIIDKNNSSLPQIISMPPDKIRFFGSVKMNPSGDPGHLRNNYVFGNSRILGDVEIQVPLNFKMEIQVADTMENFLADMLDRNDDFNWNDLQTVSLKFEVQNGFPLGLELRMDLYDSGRDRIIGSVESVKLLEPAPTDAAGKVTGIKETSAVIDLPPDFCKSIYDAGNIILSFRLNTTDSDSKNVKIYSDYKVSFSAALLVSADINLK